MLKYWIWLSTRQNVSGAQAIALLSRFGSAVAIYQADEEALKRGSDAFRRVFWISLLPAQR